jgi:phage terminase large subunit-like protein
MNQSSPDRMDALVWALTELSSSSGACRMIMA